MQKRSVVYYAIFISLLVLLVLGGVVAIDIQQRWTAMSILTPVVSPSPPITSTFAVGQFVTLSGSTYSAVFDMPAGTPNPPGYFGFIDDNGDDFKLIWPSPPPPYPTGYRAGVEVIITAYIINLPQQNPPVVGVLEVKSVRLKIPLPTPTATPMFTPIPTANPSPSVLPTSTKAFTVGQQVTVSGTLSILIIDYFITPVPTNAVIWNYVLTHHDTSVTYLRFDTDRLISQVKPGTELIVTGKVLEVNGSGYNIAIQVQSFKVLVR
jgi:hypothetical protein